MTTIKLKFRPSTLPHSEGTLYFQLIHKRNVRWISTGYHIYADEWDETAASIKTGADGRRGTVLRMVKTSVEWDIKQRKSIIEKMQARATEFTLDELCEAFKTIAPCKTVFTFLQEQVMKKELMNRQGTKKTYASAYRRFWEFRNAEDLTFSELTSDQIEQYEAWLTNRGLKQNTIRFYLRTLNTLLHKAVDEGVATNQNWFVGVRLSYVKTIKRAISESDIRAIEKLSLPVNSPLAFARDVFMFSFYMRGMPFVDIAYLKKKNLRYGVVEYCRKKTNQHLAIAWEREQQTIVDRYAHLTRHSAFMFPIIRYENGTEYQQYRLAQDSINRSLKKIGRLIGLRLPLTLYVARHSWANIARNMNFSIAIISECMGHHSYRTTQTYLDTIDSSIINNVNKKIIQRIQRGK